MKTDNAPSIGIIAAMQVEIEAVRGIMVNPAEVQQGRFKFTSGTISDRHIVVADCGIGPVNAALVTQKMIDSFHVERIIHTGIAGALVTGCPPQTVILADSCCYHDFSHEILNTFFPFQSVFYSDPEMLEIAKAALGRDNPLRVGRIVSGNSFISSSAVRKQIIELVGGLCVDMESAAVAHTATINEVPFLVVRAVSDLADDDAETVYEEHKAPSARAAAEVVMAVVNKLT